MPHETEILYIHPIKRNPRTRADYSVMPVGIIAILNLLKEHHYQVAGLNLGVEVFLNPEFELERELQHWTYKILLIDLHWYEHSFAALEISRIAKQIYPEKPVVLGGMTAGIFAGEIIHDYRTIDFIVKGDSEEPILRLCEFLLRGTGSPGNMQNICYLNNGTVRNPALDHRCEDLDCFNFTDIDFMQNREYIYYTTPFGLQETGKSYWLCIGRGCLYNCNYCCGSRMNQEQLFGRRDMLVRSPPVVAADIQTLADRGVRLLCPTHDFQMFGRAWWQELYRLLPAINQSLYLECFQLPTVDFILETLEVFRPAGSIFVISPLTGSDDLRRKAGKGFTNRDYLELLTHLAAKQVNLQLYYSINVAAETEETLGMTCDQIREILDFYPREHLKIMFQKVVLDPLAPMRSSSSGCTFSLNSFADYYHYSRNGSEEDISYTDNIHHSFPHRWQEVEAFKAELNAELGMQILV